MIRLPFEDTKNLLVQIFTAYGFSSGQSETITDSLLAADLAGVESHGIQRMIRYHDAITKGMVVADATPQMVWETPISAVIDAHKAMGQLVSKQAMNLAIKKAADAGIGMVAVRNSNHFGIAGYYARMAVEKGFIGGAMTNSEAIMVPTGSRQARLGTNPIAVAFPADPLPFCFDAATTVVPRGKLEVYRKAGKTMPEGWAMGADGVPSNDPDKVIRNISDRSGGGILPLGGSEEMTGGHKGYGFGMICELFTSILSGGPPSYQTYQQPDLADTAHCFWAMDLRLFGDPQTLQASCSDLLEDIRRSAPAEQGQRIYIHGEKEVEFAHGVHAHGIPANEKTVEELRTIARDLRISFQIN